MWKTLLALCLIAGPAAAQIPGLTLTPVPIPSPRTVNPYRIGPGSNGRIWFTDVTFLPRQVGFITSTGAITAFKLIDSADPNNEVRPLAITEGPDGNGWFTISVTDSSGSPLRTEIGRVTPTGVITRFPTPTVDACRVFGGAPVCGITVGPDGNLWFTETQMKRIGKITLSGQITEFLADGPGGEFFYEITAGPDGNLWVADSGSDIIRITPAGVITFFSRQGLIPVGITAGPDGNVWFTAGATDGSRSIGRITPTGTITLFPTPSPTLSPFDIVAGSDGKLYFTEGAAADQKIGQLDPATGVINESAVTGRGVLREIIAISGGSSSGMGIAQTEKVKLAVQSTDPPLENVTRVEIEFTAPPSPPELTLHKEVFSANSQNWVAFINVREGEKVRFRLTVTNRGDIATTVDWRIDDFVPPGLKDCRKSGPNADKFTATTALDGTVTLRPFASYAVLQKEQSLMIELECQTAGPFTIENGAEVSGGGSDRDLSNKVAVVAYGERGNLLPTPKRAPRRISGK